MPIFIIGFAIFMASLVMVILNVEREPCTFVSDITVMRGLQRNCLDAGGTFKIMQAQGGWTVKCSTINLTHERSKAR
jgi:hypothetical protein